MDWGNVFEPGLPFNPGTIGQDDQQHLLWGQSDELWTALIQAEGGAIISIWKWHDY